MDRYWYVTKRDVVCFKRGRFNLEKIEKKLFLLSATSEEPKFKVKWVVLKISFAC